MKPEEELELVIKNMKNISSQISVLHSGMNSITEEINHLQRKRVFLYDDYHRLSLEATSTEQEQYDYILDGQNSANNESNYISNNLEKYLPKGCHFRGNIFQDSNQREIVLNLNLEPSKNEEKILKIFSHIKNINLNLHISNIISTSKDGKIISLSTTSSDAFYRIVYANDIESYYLLHKGCVIYVGKSIKEALRTLEVHSSKTVTCSSYML